jgi:hypothetical protein
LRTSQSSEASHSPAAVFRALAPEHRLAAVAALALGASIFLLPWWRDPVFGISYVGFRRLTFLELALLLVALSVLVLVWQRGEGRGFHLPLSDGTLIAAAGLWSAFLVLLRMLDPPTRTLHATGRHIELTRDYGLRWGLFVALTSAGALAVAGVRMRRRYHPGEPEAVAADADATPTLTLER